MSPYVVKTALLFYGILSFLSIFLLWRNASAPDALKNAGVVVASILPIALSVFTYLIPEKLVKKYNYMLLLDSQDGYFTLGDQPNSYLTAYIPVLANIPADSFSRISEPDLWGKESFDLLERGVLECLLSKFLVNWCSGTGSTNKNTVISIEKLKAIFNHNRFVNMEGVVGPHQLTLPPKSKIEVLAKDRERRIQILNSQISIDIIISPRFNMPFQQGLAGVQNADPNNLNRFWGAYFQVALEGKIGLAKSHSPDMGQYRQWFEDVGEALNSLDWEKIREDISQSRLQDAASKILDR